MVAQYYNNYVDTTNFSDTTAQINMAANHEITYTVPGPETLYGQVIFSFMATSNVFVGYNTTVTVPSSNTIVTGAQIEYKPEKRFVKGGDVLHFISPDTITYFGISVRALPSGS